MNAQVYMLRKKIEEKYVVSDSFWESIMPMIERVLSSDWPVHVRESMMKQIWLTCQRQSETETAVQEAFEGLNDWVEGVHALAGKTLGSK